MVWRSQTDTSYIVSGETSISKTLPSQHHLIQVPNQQGNLRTNMLLLEIIKGSNSSYRLIDEKSDEIEKGLVSRICGEAPAQVVCQVYDTEPLSARGTSEIRRIAW
jgi:hypothetical protein